MLGPLLKLQRLGPIVLPKTLSNCRGSVKTSSPARKSTLGDTALTPSLSGIGFFAPANWVQLNDGDADPGSVVHFCTPSAGDGEIFVATGGVLFSFRPGSGGAG